MATSIFICRLGLTLQNVRIYYRLRIRIAAKTQQEVQDIKTFLFIIPAAFPVI
jgi:hypothetical protein